MAFYDLILCLESVYKEMHVVVSQFHHDYPDIDISNLAFVIGCGSVRVVYYPSLGGDNDGGSEKS